MAPAPRKPRVLVIEDGADRVAALRRWSPPDVNLVAASGGQATGVVRRDRSKTFAGVALDHDLQVRIRADADRAPQAWRDRLEEARELREAE